LPRLLALDWDNREFHLVSANVHRGKVHIDRAVSWQVEEPFVVTKAEEFGQRLKDEMAKAGIAAAPLIVCLGRDKVVVKEVRYPQVGADVEASIVRNQITKDLTESPDEVVLDYAPLPEPARNGERRALSLVVRKATIQALGTVARVAGLRLASVSARPYGAAACYKHLAGTTPQVPAPPSPDAVVAVLTVTQHWAEFSVVRGQNLLFARPMVAGEGLLGEVRRNLAAYAGQPQLSFPRDAVQALYVCGNGENAVLREKLQETLGIAVHGLDPFVTQERVTVDAANRAGFTGAVGLLQLWAVDQTTPVNFVKPRENIVTTSPAKKRALAYSALGVFVMIFVVLGAIWIVNQNLGEAAELRDRLDDKKKQLTAMDADRKYLEGLEYWTDANIPWLDEIYDLAVRVPLEDGFKVTRLEMTSTVPVAPKGKDKDKAAPKAKGKGKDLDRDGLRFTSTVKIVGMVKKVPDKLEKVQKLMDLINQDKYCYCTKINEKTVGTDQMEFTLKVDIAHRPMNQYKSRLVLIGQAAGK